MTGHGEKKRRTGSSERSKFTSVRERDSQVTRRDREETNIGGSQSSWAQQVNQEMGQGAGLGEYQNPWTGERLTQADLQGQRGRTRDRTLFLGDSLIRDMLSHDGLQYVAFTENWDVSIWRGGV